MANQPDLETLLRVAKACAAKAFGVPVMGVESGKNRRCNDARRAVIWFLKKQVGLGWDVVSPRMGYKHHSGCQYHLRQHAGLLESSAPYRERFNRFVSLLTSESMYQTEDSNDAGHQLQGTSV